MVNFDVGEPREYRQRRAGQERFRIAIEHRAGEMHAHDAVGLAILVLQAPDESIFRRERNFSLVTLGRCVWFVDPDAFGYVVLYRFDQDGPVGGELEPMPARRLFRHEGAAALM